MKKLLAILLSLSLLFSFAACGADAQEDDDEEKKDVQDATGGANLEDNEIPELTQPQQTEPLPAEPSKEEKNMLYLCSDIINCLEAYAKNGRFDRSFASSCEGHQGYKFYGLAYSGQETQWVLSYCYEKLEAMSAVDKWVDSQWVKDEGLNVDRKAALANFTVLQDKFIRTMQKSVDVFGQSVIENIDYAEVSSSLEYNEQGQVILSQYGNGFTYVHRSDSRYVDINLNYLGDSLGSGVSCYTYNEDGTIAKIDAESFDRDDGFQTEFRMTPTYDNSGKIATMTVLSAIGEETTLEYNYDEQGRLASVYNARAEYTWTYTYDTNGNVLTESARYRNSGSPAVMTYTYDAQNRVIAAEYNHNSETHKCTYTYDEAGHLATCKITGLPDGVTNEVTYDYGNYYIYNPAK